MSRKKTRLLSPIMLPTGVEPPFPSNPSRPTRIGIYISNHRVNYAGFYSLYAAHAFLEQFLDQPHDWVNDDLIQFEDFSVSTRGNGLANLREINDYTPTAKEAEWVLPEEYHLSRRVPRQAPIIAQTTKIDRRPAPDRSGLVTLQSLTADASSARQALRKAGFVKPLTGWSWPSDHPDLEKVKKLLTNI